VASESESNPLLPPELLVIAYRGGVGEGTENTLETCLQTARRCPRAAIELDIRCTRDDVFVAFHDATLDRMTGCSGRLEQLRFADLQHIALKGGRKIPALATILEKVDAPLVLDVRLDRPQQMDALLRLTEPAKSRIAWACESERTLRWLLQRAPHALHGPSWWRGGVNWVGLSTSRLRAPLWMVPARVGPLRPLPAFAKRLRQGERLWTWLIDDAQQARRLSALGVHGVFTAHPTRISAALRPTPQLASPQRSSQAAVT